MRAAGLRRDELFGNLALRATLGGPSPYSPAAEPSYRITKLERASAP